MTHHELVTLNDNNVPTTTSLKVAEHFGKNHKNILRKIETLECSVEFARLNFELCSRTVGGREFPMYEMTRDGFSFLVNKMSGPKAAEFTEKFIGAFNAMEEELEGKRFAQFEIPQTLSEALMLAAKQAEQIELMEPKAEAHDAYLSSDGTMSLTEAAKALHMTAHRMCKMLRDDEVLFHKNYHSTNVNLPMAGYEEYFKVVKVPTVDKKGWKKWYAQTKVTHAGLEWLRQNYSVTTPNLKVV
jgi:Rha family phage regulatory protein